MEIEKGMTTILIHKTLNTTSFLYSLLSVRRNELSPLFGPNLLVALQLASSTNSANPQACDHSRALHVHEAMRAAMRLRAFDHLQQLTGHLQVRSSIP